MIRKERRKQIQFIDPRTFFTKKKNDKRRKRLLLKERRLKFRRSFSIKKDDIECIPLPIAKPVFNISYEKLYIVDNKTGEEIDISCLDR